MLIVFSRERWAVARRRGGAVAAPLSVFKVPRAHSILIYQIYKVPMHL